MDDPAVTAKQLVDLAKKHIEDQQCRIVRQRELSAKYERDDDVARLSGARLVLERMQKQLAQMTAAHVAAEEHLSKLTVDEQALKRSCGTPQCSASSSRSRPTCCANACRYALANKGMAPEPCRLTSAITISSTRCATPELDERNVS